MSEKETAYIREVNADFEVASLHEDFAQEPPVARRLAAQLKFLLAGICFGVILIKGEVISWFRIQEMFRLQSFHMYGVIGSAVVVGMVSVWILKKGSFKTIYGMPIQLHPRAFNRGQVYGGLLFGFGWALTGACPGPLYAQIGAGTTVFIVPLLSALAGTWVYGLLSRRLPH